ncbi:MAG TPA: hypothetical protein PK629_02505 [Oscillospiraceae bacterium]|nr:hypothetical protein [Oscillospiraceae bacterium]HPF55629.1 hypothetical protein [Clostridiales bacterium]HPK34196.1 hypothetical protein [Oscillospiraceae bacterium]HPR74901.1 hypothetical protein [Oscillospiraceae bacterium]
MKTRRRTKWAAALLFGILIAVNLFCFTPGALTDEEYNQLVEEQLTEFGADEVEQLPDEQTKVLLEQIGLGEINPSEFLDLQPDSMAEIIMALTKKSYPAPLAACFAVCAVLLIGQLMNGLRLENRPGFEKAYQYFAVVAAASAILIPLVSRINESFVRIDEASVFMTGFVPVFTAAVSASGQPISATVSAATLLAAAEIAMWAVKSVVLPACGIFAAFGMVAGVTGNADLEKLSGFFKGLVVWILGAAATILVGMMSLKSFLSSAADSVTIRTLKMLVSGSVPIVGGGLSDAVSSVVSCFSLIKNAFGFFGVAAVLLCVLPEIITIAIWKLAVGLCSALASSTDQKGVAKLLKTLGDMLSIVIAALVLTVLVFIVGIAVMMKTYGGI